MAKKRPAADAREKRPSKARVASAVLGELESDLRAHAEVVAKFKDAAIKLGDPELVILTKSAYFYLSEFRQIFSTQLFGKLLAHSSTRGGRYSHDLLSGLLKSMHELEERLHKRLPVE